MGTRSCRFHGFCKPPHSWTFDQRMGYAGGDRGNEVDPVGGQKRVSTGTRIMMAFCQTADFLIFWHPSPGR